MSRCINLKKTFPGYRVTLDPACEDARDPWYFQIPGKKGTIYPYGSKLLAVEVDYHPGITRELERAGLEHSQCGDGEHTFLFREDQFPFVARLVQSRRKRQLSPEARAKAAERLKQARSKLRKKPAKSL